MILEYRTKKCLSREIINFIAENNFRQGDSIPSERKLSELFKASRNSIREALRKLETQSVVEIKPGSGCYVKTPEIEILADVETDSRAIALQQLEARFIIDPAVIKLATGRMDDKFLARFKSLLMKFRREILTRNVAVISNIDFTIRMLLARSTENNLLQMMLMQLERYNCLLWQMVKEVSDEELNELSGAYVKIFHSIKKHDSTAAENDARSQVLMLHRYFNSVSSTGPEEPAAKRPDHV